MLDHRSLGYAWLRIGGLRYHLLVNSDEVDPAMKYSYKHSKLSKNISQCEIELEVAPILFIYSLNCSFSLFLLILLIY